MAIFLCDGDGGGGVGQPRSLSGHTASEPQSSDGRGARQHLCQYDLGSQQGILLWLL